MNSRDQRPSLLAIRDLHERYHSPALQEPTEAPRYSMRALDEPLPYVDAVTPVERHGSSRKAAIRIHNLGGGELKVTPRPSWEGGGRPAKVTLREGDSQATSDVRLPRSRNANQTLAVDIHSPATRDWWTHTELDVWDAATNDAPAAVHVERQWQLWKLAIVDATTDSAQPHEYFLIAAFDSLPSHVVAVDCEDGVWIVEAQAGGQKTARYRCDLARNGSVCPPMEENDSAADGPTIRIPCPDGARSATSSEEWLQPQRVARLRRRDTSVRVVRAVVALDRINPGVTECIIETAGPDGPTGSVRCVVVAPVVAELGELTVDGGSAVQVGALDVPRHHPSVRVDPSCDIGRVMRFGDETYTYAGGHVARAVSVSSDITAWRPVAMDPAMDGVSWEAVVGAQRREGHHDYRFDVGGEWRADPLRLTRVVWGEHGLISCRPLSPVVHDVNVENQGKQAVAVTVRSDADWVTASPASQTIPAGATGSVTVRIDPWERPLGASLASIEVHVDGDWAPVIVPVYAWVDVDSPVLDVHQLRHSVGGPGATSVDIPVRVWGDGEVRVQALAPRSVSRIEVMLKGTGYGTPDEQAIRVPLGDPPARGRQVGQLKLLSDSYLGDRRAVHVDIEWPGRREPEAILHLPRIFPHDRAATAFVALNLDGDDWDALDIRLPEQMLGHAGIRCEPCPTRRGCVLSIDPRATPPGRLLGFIELVHPSFDRPRRIHIDAHVLDSSGKCDLRSLGERRFRPGEASHVLTIRNVGSMELMVFEVRVSDGPFTLGPAVPPRTILGPGEALTADVFVKGRSRWIPRTVRGSIQVLLSDAQSGGHPWVGDVSARV